MLSGAWWPQRNDTAVEDRPKHTGHAFFVCQTNTFHDKSLGADGHPQVMQTMQDV